MTRPDPVYQLYAAEISYFSGKVRPALRRKGVPFVEHLPTPAAYRDVILPRTGLGFIPIVVTPEDETWQDTSEILDALEARHPEPALYPATPVQRVVALLLEVYCDELLVLPALHYRWSFPESEAKARADFAAMNGEPAMASRFADRMQGALAAVGVVPETIPAIEAHTRELFEALETHLAGHPYLLGDRMSLADCALLGPLYAHFYLDAVPGRLIRQHLRVCHWIERMNHPDPAAPGAWLAADALAPTLRPLLALAAEAVPMLLGAIAAFETWADARPAGTDEPPRVVGTYTTSFRGVPMRRYTSPYAAWMLQRPLDAWRALPPADRDRVHAALAGTGLEALLALAPRHRLGKRRFRLVFEG